MMIIGRTHVLQIRCGFFDEAVPKIFLNYVNHLLSLCSAQLLRGGNWNYVNRSHFNLLGKEQRILSRTGSNSSSSSLLSSSSSSSDDESHRRGFNGTGTGINRMPGKESAPTTRGRATPTRKKNRLLRLGLMILEIFSILLTGTFRRWEACP